MPPYRLDLFGPLGLFDPTGRRIELTSKRGMALVALLATARGGIRARGWVQDMLWGSRAPAQAQASLRRELSNLRQVLNDGATQLLDAGFGRIALNVGRIDVAAPGPGSGEFLEGLDIPGEEGFEDWLRGKRGEARPAASQLPRPPRTSVPDTPGDAFLQSAAVAVLPFANLTGAREFDYIAEAIAEDLINLLSRQRWIPVIARSTSFTYSSERQTLQEIGHELGAGFIVEGRLRGSGDALGLAASIADADAGHILWSRRIEFPVTARSEDIGNLLAEVAGGLSNQLNDFEMRRAMMPSRPQTQASDLVWRARWHHNQFTRQDGEIARALFEEAIAKEPHSSEAIIQYALFKQRQIWLMRGSREEMRDLRRLAQRAIAADYSDGRGYMIAGLADLWMRDLSSAIALFQQAISLNPSLAYAYAQLGAAYYLNGDPALALEMLNRSLRLDLGEIYGFYVLTEIAMARAMLGDWSEAIAMADQGIGRRHGYWYAHVIKIHCLVSRGDHANARLAYRALRDACADFSTDMIDWLPFADRRWNARLRDSVTGTAARGVGD